MADVLFTIALILIAFSILFGILRLILGKTTVDRVIAIDLLTVVSIAIIALYAHYAERYIYLDVALVYGLLSFLGVLANKFVGDTSRVSAVEET